MQTRNMTTKKEMIKINVRYIFKEYYNGEKNPFTPTIIKYGYKKFGNKTLLYEKSRGKGLFDAPLYGISFLYLNNETNEVQKIDLGKAFGELKEVDKYLKSIGLNEIHNANLYGEVKIINT